MAPAFLSPAPLKTPFGTKALLVRHWDITHRDGVVVLLLAAASLALGIWPGTLLAMLDTAATASELRWLLPLFPKVPNSSVEASTITVRPLEQLYYISATDLWELCQVALDGELRPENKESPQLVPFFYGGRFPLDAADKKSDNQPPTKKTLLNHDPTSKPKYLQIYSYHCSGF